MPPAVPHSPFSFSRCMFQPAHLSVSALPRGSSLQEPRHPAPNFLSNLQLKFLIAFFHRGKEVTKQTQIENKPFILPELKSYPPFSNTIKIGTAQLQHTIYLAHIFLISDVLSLQENYLNGFSCVSRFSQRSTVWCVWIILGTISHCLQFSWCKSLFYQLFPKSVLNTINQLCLHIPLGKSILLTHKEKEQKKEFSKLKILLNQSS